MKKLLTGVLLLFSPLASLATHIIAYDGYATCIAETQNEITLKIDIILYRDAAASAVMFDDPLELGIYVNKVNGSLVKKANMDLVKEFAPFPGQSGFEGIRQGEYSATLNLPKNATGYSLIFQRCCFPISDNIVYDIGFDLRIEIPSGMADGDKTPTLTAFPSYSLKAGTRYSFPHPFLNTLYDSVRIEYTAFYTGGTSSDPLPTPPFNMPPATLNGFKAGYSAQNPLGVNSTCDYTSEPDSLILQVNQNGQFILPISLRCFLNGSEKIYSRIIRVSVSGAPVNYLNLTFNGATWTTVNLTSHTVISGTDILVLERSPDTLFTSFADVETGIAHGMGINLTDDSIVLASPLYYRLKLKSNPIQYSNRVEVLPTGTGSIEGRNFFPFYPNPADRTVRIELPQASEYTLYSWKGELIRQGMLEEGHNELAVYDVPAGIYLLRINGSSQKLVISH